MCVAILKPIYGAVFSVHCWPLCELGLQLKFYRSTKCLHACIYSFLSPKIQQTYLWKPYILSDKWTLLRFSVSVPACLYVCKHVCLVIYLLGTFWSTVASINSNWSAYRISNAYNTHSCTQWMTPKRFQY